MCSCFWNLYSVPLVDLSVLVPMQTRSLITVIYRILTPDSSLSRYHSSGITFCFRPFAFPCKNFNINIGFYFERSNPDSDWDYICLCILLWLYLLSIIFVIFI